MLERLDRYCFLHGIFRTVELGAGKDGTIYGTSRGTAIKVHARVESYTSERDVYFRLRDRQIRRILTFNIPRLKNYDDDCLVLEMSIVTPPYLLDFASAWLDTPPDFSREVINEWHDRLRESFGARFPDIMNLLETLANQAGGFMLDIHPHNVKFEPDVLP